jgi:hypothetical protein
MDHAVVRIGALLSAVVVVGAMVLSSVAVSNLDDAGESFGAGQAVLGFIYYSAVFSFLGLAFLWTGIFVVYVVVGVFRTHDR